MVIPLHQQGRQGWEMKLNREEGGAPLQGSLAGTDVWDSTPLMPTSFGGGSLAATWDTKLALAGPGAKLGAWAEVVGRQRPESGGQGGHNLSAG